MSNEFAAGDARPMTAGDTRARSSASPHLGMALKELLERVADFTDDVVLITEAEPIDGPGPMIVYVNPAFTRMTGYTAAEVIGQTPRILQGPRTDPQAKARISAALQAWRAIRVELLNYRKDGSEFWVELSITPVADETGWFRYWLAVQRDVTLAKQHEQERVAAQRLRAVGEMTGGIAHDFNNLLTAISGGAELLSLRCAGQPELQALAETIRGAAARGTAQVRRLMAFSRTPLLARTSIDLREALAQLSALLRLSLRDNITLLSEVHPDAVWVDAEAAQLEGALLNLALNAQDAMPDGGHLEISARSLHDSRGVAMVEVTVADSGVGMNAETMARVFEPFFSTKPAGRGSGLGLAMVNSFVTQLGGRIEVQSSLGKGSTFVLVLPAADAPVAALPEATAANPVPACALRVLLVEDDEVVRTIAEAMLRLLGHEVTALTCADEALSVLESKLPLDLLLTDILMPGALGGLELAEAAHWKRPGLAVVLSSGWADSDLPVVSPRDPRVPFLMKPYSLAELQQALDAATAPALRP